MGWRVRRDGRHLFTAFPDRRESLLLFLPSAPPYLLIDGLHRGVACVQDLLSPLGVFYLVAIKQNKPLEIIESIRTRFEGRLDGKVSFFTSTLFRLAFAHLWGVRSPD